MFQVTWNLKIGTVGRIFFLYCSKFLHGNNRETVCQNAMDGWMFELFIDAQPQ